MTALEPPTHVGMLCRSVTCVCPPLSGHRHPAWIAYEAAVRGAERRAEQHEPRAAS